MDNLEQLLQQKIDELEPYEPVADTELEEIDVNWFAPIEGVSFERWAAICAGTMVGARLEILLDDARIEPTRWRSICEQWLAKLTRDSTMVIAATLEAALRRVSRRLARGSVPPHHPMVPQE